MLKYRLHVFDAKGILNPGLLKSRKDFNSKVLPPKVYCTFQSRVGLTGFACSLID